MVISYRKTTLENNHKNLPQVSPRCKGGGAYACVDMTFRRMRHCDPHKKTMGWGYQNLYSFLKRTAAWGNA